MLTIDYLRSFRIGPYAIFDFAASFLGIYLLSPILSKLFLKVGLKISTKSWMLLTIPLSILIHLLVGNITPMTADFINLHEAYLLKIIVIALTYLAIKDIKRIKKTKEKYLENK